MVKKTVSGTMLWLLLFGLFALAFNVQSVKAENGIVIDGKMDDWIALSLTPCGTDYGFEYYEGWVRYYVLFDLTYRNENDDLGY